MNREKIGVKRVPDVVSIAWAADQLGGQQFAPELLQHVGLNDLRSSTHSPETGPLSIQQNYVTGVDRALPRVTIDTNPAKVLVDFLDLENWFRYYGVPWPLDAVHSDFQSPPDTAQAAEYLSPLTESLPTNVDENPRHLREDARLARLRKYGGDRVWKGGRWKSTGNGAFMRLVTEIQKNGISPFSEKSIRQDLNNAAQRALESKRNGLFSGLDSR